MMKLRYKTSILIMVVCVLSLSIFGQVLAQTNLIVDFENKPLFSEVNFAPGNTVNRWIKVTNNSGQVRDVIIEGININDQNNFSQAIDFKISDGTTNIFDNTLEEFLKSGELFLGEIGDQNTIRYDLLAGLPSDAGNEYQSLNLDFDILIGFAGTGDQATDGVGTAGGSTVLPGLSISSESVESEVQDDSVTITWNTSYLSTSQVVYAKEGENHVLDTSVANFGYERASLEDSNKVTGHNVTILKLDSNSTYYFRCISHASPATISKEFSFVTTGDSIIDIPDQESEEPIIPIIPIGQPESEIIGPQIIGELENEIEDSIIDIPNQEDVAINQDSIPNNGMLAAIGNILDYKFIGPILLLSLLIIIGFAVGKVIIWFIRRKK